MMDVQKTLTPREQYKLADSLKRARRLVAAHKAWTDYDRYLEITSYSDLDDDNYDQIADDVDRQAWRADQVYELCKSFIESHQDVIGTKYEMIVRAEGEYERWQVSHATNLVFETLMKPFVHRRYSHYKNPDSDWDFAQYLRGKAGTWDLVKFPKLATFDYWVGKPDPDQICEFGKQIVDHYYTLNQGECYQRATATWHFTKDR